MERQLTSSVEEGTRGGVEDAHVCCAYLALEVQALEKLLLPRSVTALHAASAVREQVMLLRSVSTASVSTARSGGTLPY